jgi:hypothetical protein
MRTIIFFCLILFLAACQGQKSGATNDSLVQEITNPELVNNADIIRNPASAKTPKDTSKVAKLAFAETHFNFGGVRSGVVVEHEFSFTNTGKVPLVISHAESTCGCTVPEWPKKPVMPGESGVLKVKFNTLGKDGDQSKPVTITANTIPAETKVYIEGFVSLGMEKFIRRK